MEVWRTIRRQLIGADAPAARDAFRADWAFVAVVEIDSVLAEEAGRLVTADLRQAQAARSLGWAVLGA